MNIHLPAILMFTRGTRVLTHPQMMNHLDSLRDELWSRPSGGNGAKYVEEAQKGRHSFLHVFWNIKLDTMWNWLICFGGVCV